MLMVALIERGGCGLEDGPFTIFAPTDEAFQCGDDLAVLDTPEGKEQLSDILLTMSTLERFYQRT